MISAAGLDGLVVAAGFSGHGFKIAPAVGRLVADLVVDGHSNDPRIPHTDFRLSRFADDDLLKSPYPYWVRMSTESPGSCGEPSQ